MARVKPVVFEKNALDLWRYWAAVCVMLLHYLTYGIFLYHWIVLNAIVYFDGMNRLPWVLALLIYVSATVLLAALSHFTVGKWSGKAVSRLTSGKKNRAGEAL